MSKSSEAVKRWRKNVKHRIVESMGGSCQICGYNKCDEALDLHHINPEEKEIGFAKIRANPQSWKKIVDELRKCVLLCNRCHSELHAGVTKLPDTYKSFNEEFIDYKKVNLTNECPVCGKEKPIKYKHCSLKCAGKSGRKVDWDNINLEQLFIEYKTQLAVAEHLGISDQAVYKRAKKIGLK